MSIAVRAAVAGGLVSLLVAATVTAAQQPLAEITVQGQRDVFANNEAKLVTRTRQVSYKDLSLATSSGAAELQKRVSDAAEDLCHQLLALYPPEVSGGFMHTSGNCVAEATADAMKQANTVIAAAKHSPASPAAGGG